MKNLGNFIAGENVELRDDILKSINDIRFCGDVIIKATKEFSHDPFNSAKREFIIQSAKELLRSVANLLALVDLIDVNLLLKLISMVQTDIESLKHSNNQDELSHHYKRFGQNMIDLSNHAAMRQAVI